ncbi:MAG TPA: hypothetical protein VL137_05865 [Polyangiaceae bacterium]|jgi:hypothetical protein|nr:hypothetical protein [Polyangiaceae bacterium]
MFNAQYSPPDVIHGPGEQLGLAFLDNETLLWQAVLGWGDPVALRSLADSLDDVEDEEIGTGD